MRLRTANHTCIGAVLVVLLLLAPAATAGWTQDRGGPGDAGTASLPDQPLDLLRTFELGVEGVLGDSRQVLIDTEAGLVGVLTTNEGAGVTCTAARLVDPMEGTFEPFAELAASSQGCDLVGSIPSQDALLVCIDGPPQTEVLQVFDADTGAHLWGISPDLGVAGADAPDATQWWCNDAIVDEEEDRLVTIFSNANGDHRVQAHWLDGGHIWTSVVPGHPFSSLPPEPKTQQFGYENIVQTDQGILLIGTTLDRSGDEQDSDVAAQGALAWFSVDGEFVDRLEGFDVCGSEDRAPTVSQGAAARGTLVAAVLCDELILVNPEVPGARWVPLEPRQAFEFEVFSGFSISRFDMSAPPAWSRESLLVPRDDKLFVFDGRNPGGIEAVWSLNPEAEVIDTVIDDGLAHVLVKTATSDDPEEIVTLRLPGAEPIQRIPLEGRTRADLNAMTLTPWDGGLLVVGRDGQLSVLGTASAGSRPTVEVSTSYPAVGEPVLLDVTFAETPSRVIIGWGDGLVETFDPFDPLERTYATAGDAALHVTAVYEDGRTGTARQVLHVGQDPPQDLNAIQRAFARENQDLTFGILGILVAVAGGLIALATRRRRRGILQRELDAIDEAYSMTRDDPQECNDALNERRTRCRGLLLDGKLDEGQYAILEKHIEELSGNVRLGVLDGRFDYLPLGIVRRLRQMLADGRVSTWERDHFEEILNQDHFLSKAQKDEVRAVIESWFGQDMDRGMA